MLSAEREASPWKGEIKAPLLRSCVEVCIVSSPLKVPVLCRILKIPAPQSEFHPRDTFPVEVKEGGFSRQVECLCVTTHPLEGANKIKNIVIMG